MAASTRIHPPTRVLRVTAWTVIVAAIVLVAAVLADGAAASRAEHRIAVAITDSPGVTYEPEVTLGGVPFLSRASSGEFPTVLISARGVTITGCGDRGACTATVDGRLADPVFGDVWQVDADTPIDASAITAETRVDSVNLGRLMGITDLYINTPAPEGKIGGGGPGDGLLERTDGIMLSGTVPLPGSPEYNGAFPPSASGYRFPKVKISVTAKTFVVDGRVHIQATGIYDGPEEHYSADVPKEFYSAVLKRFSAVLPALPMAWDVTPEKSLSRGSDLIVVGNTSRRTVKPVDFVAARDADA